MSASQSHRPLALVTGATGGLGLASCRGLLQAGYDVVLSGRNMARGQAARDALARDFPQAQLDFATLDLSSLEAIGSFAREFRSTRGRLDVLINNAGLFPPNRRAGTTDGFESCFGVGFYGHFALTAELLPALLAARVGRVVTVSSIAHRGARLPLDDPQLRRDYDPTRTYASCKLACLLFSRELDRQARAAGTHLLSIAAHPGIARTRLGQYADNPPTSLRDRAVAGAMWFAMRFLSQEATAGARPIIHAATSPRLAGGEFVGPDGFGQFRGAPRIVRPHAPTLTAQDPAALWSMAEAQTGRRFDWGG